MSFYSKIFTVLSALTAVTALPFIPHVDIELENGDTITGLRKLGVESFRGIPYGEPPVGDMRFKPSVPYEGSLDGFEALDFGNACYQANPKGIMDILRSVGRYTEWITPSLLDGLKNSKMSEDCLNLNVYRPPKTKPDAKLPVIVYVYGGAFQFGSTHSFPGGRFVRDSEKIGQPVIYVSFNYRMGPWGFLGGSALGAENSTNAGVYDAINAFKWVRENIAAFGGDPSRVTALGSGTGAMLLSHLMLSDQFKEDPLFQAVSLQSGSVLPYGSSSGLAADNMFWKLANETGCRIDVPGAQALQCLREVDAETLSKAQNYNHNITEFFDLSTALSIWAPRYDNNLWKKSPFDLVNQGQFPDIPMMIGENMDEGTTVALLFATQTKNETNDKFRRLFPIGGQNLTQFLDFYSEDPADGAPFNTGEKYQIYPDYKRSAAILTDVFFTIPRRLILQNTGCNTSPRYVYYNSAGHDIPFVGASHLTDAIWQFYLFRNYASDAFRRYTISFANNHNPNVNTGLTEWPEWDDEEQQVLHIQQKQGSIITDDYRTEKSDYALERLLMFSTL